ncbi:MAG: amylo-alpha-1,6-glucosidase [Anaerolineae bacterium]
MGRRECGDLRISGKREWLITNGIGGYASGTIAGLLTRRYHGLLVAAVQPPVGRTLMLAKLDEVATYHGEQYPLFANWWAEGEVEPTGFRYLERFHLEGTTPVWTYALADALLEKRVWMEPGENVTYVRYHVMRGQGRVDLQIKALVNYRNHHDNTHAEDTSRALTVEPVARGLRITARGGRTPLYLLSDRGRTKVRHTWYRDYYLAEEAYRGLNPLDDNLHAGLYEASLEPGESLTVVAGAGPRPHLDAGAAHARRQAHEAQRLREAGSLLGAAPAEVRHLVLAADQFVVRRSRPLPEESGGGTEEGQSLIAGYPWFNDWGRDTMISLPGLALATGRADLAAGILRTYACYVDEGMLPNRFPDEGEKPQYNTADATLWYFEAIRAYHAVTADDDLLRELFPVLADVVAWHRRGTRYGIQLDLDDGLLFAGQEGTQLTWMDAKVDDWVATPRVGKAVEINALWYHALRVMVGFACRLGEDAGLYEELARKARRGFERFWNEERGYCFDVLDSPGDGAATAIAALRPNQLMAVSLHHSPLSPGRQRAVVDACARHLLTSHGMRSLAPDDPGYIGHYGGNRRERDGAYHQGTVWAWLIGPFVRGHLRVYGDRAAARSFLWPLLRQLGSHGMGSVSEIFDGDPPFTPRGCIAQAWSVAELLAAWQATAGDEDGGG